MGHESIQGGDGFRDGQPRGRAKKNSQNPMESYMVVNCVGLVHEVCG